MTEASARRAAAPPEVPPYFAEFGRMLREPRAGERFRRGHLLLRRR